MRTAAAPLGLGVLTTAAAVSAFALSFASSGCKRRDEATARTTATATAAANANANATATATATTSSEGEDRKPPGCDAIKVRRAWRFRGYATVEAGESAELVALHLSHHESEGFGVWLLDKAGERFDTPLQIARVDANGTPLDRLDASVYARGDSPAEIVVIGAVAKGTREMKLGLRDGTSLLGTPYCSIPVDLGEGPTWPPKPEIDIVRLAEVEPRKYLALVRLKHLLPEEWPAPQLQLGKTKERNFLVRADAHALVAADANGEPGGLAPRAAVRFVVAEYRWQDDGAPHEWVSWVSSERPLPDARSWNVSPGLRAALDRGAAVLEAGGRRKAALVAYGGADAGSPPKAAPRAP